ncbi:MAG TPA: amylo-alpha-1,6-glucosidase [Steroidobacteraceae bacterium]|nr:amylo-alpha-1,6-glucosidase [Steroidobacteraceae bacterium]
MLSRDVLNEFDGAARREWLVTNGLGGFACSTLAGVNTRRYHGLLVAALRPPLERTLMVAKLDVAAIYRGRRFELATNEYADGTIAPRGYVLLDSFRLDGAMPVWTWQIGDALVEQRVWMAHGSNTTYVQFSVVRASEPVHLELTPLCTYRDYHSQHRGYRETLVTQLGNGVRVDAWFGAQPYRLLADRGTCAVVPERYWNFRHRAETERGLDDLEDLFRPALFTMTLAAGESGAMTLTASDAEPLPAAQALRQEFERQAVLLQLAPDAPESFTQLCLAADQFVVQRQGGLTVIAGYPWFGDWGRDTMIALPGLTLATGRPEIAANILRTFAAFVSDGLLPNRFPDGAEAPEYNTVDATLWYFVAIDEYVRASGDRKLLEELFPVLRSIVRWHQRGTRHGICVDEQDGLLRAGEDGVQLTWMDAKIGDWVVTPRTGKAVEINALWFNTLAIMRDFAQQLGDAEAAREYGSASEQVARSFNERFWYAEGGYLYDVVDSPGGDDASLRPNQLFAISLRHPLLENGRAKAVLDKCMQELWTPVGLRSLAPTDPRYLSHYGGSPRDRDAAYHQGTVWSWLLGPFAIAHYRIYNDAPAALALLNGIAPHLRDACIGQVSEIFDAEAPFAPRGCFAQAWGVAETLRAWSEINDSEAQTRSSKTRKRAAAPRK